MKENKIAVIGLSGESIFLNVDHFHKLGETVHADSLKTECGGKGYNQAIALKKFGADVTYLSSIGKDIYGDKCEKYLIDNGVKPIMVKKDLPTALATILTDKNSENQVTVYSGATVALNKKDIEKVEIKDEPSDEVCDKCGAQMVYRMGRFGRFLACPNFPECRNTKPILTYIDAPCPKCGGKIVQKRGKNRMIFYSCEQYPTCDFSSWDIPQTETCPTCGAMLYRKKGKDYVFCHNKECGYRRDVEPLTAESAQSGLLTGEEDA